MRAELAEQRSCSASPGPQSLADVLQRWTWRTSPPTGDSARVRAASGGAEWHQVLRSINTLSRESVQDKAGV